MKIQLLKSAFLAWTLLTLINPSKAQTDLDAKPPTLQVGLDGFSFSKGSLDAQIIMEIVAEKQQELKVKAIQNLFLSKVEDAGGTVYTFVDNVVRELVFEPDQQVRTKKILENSVNLVFTAAFLNFYLSTLDKDSPSRQHLIRLANVYNNKLDTRQLIQKDKIRIQDFSVKPKTSNFFSDGNATKIIALLLDMCSKAIREDPNLKQLGLMQVAYSETYEYMNMYSRLSLTTRTSNEQEVRSIKKQFADSIFEDIKNKLRSITDNIGAVNYLVEQKTFRFNLTEGVRIKLYEKVELVESLKRIRDSLGERIKSLERELKENKLNLATVSGENLLLHYQDTALKEDINTLVKMYFYFDKAYRMIKETVNDSENRSKYKTYADILYTLNSDFIPMMINQSFRSAEFIHIISSLQGFNEALFDKITENNIYLKNQKENIPYFLQLVSRLYQFDQGSTISDYMKFLDDIGTAFPNDNIRSSLSTILKFVKDYSVIEKNDKDKEVLSFNVESFLYKLQTTKPYSLQRVEFLVTVGVNNAMFNSDFVLPDSSISRNLSFVGEKIGFKIKVWDWAFSRTRNPGETYKPFGKYFSARVRNVPPRNPMVSNLHFIGYGSGVLYNLVNTKTQKEFNMPIIAIGSGLTFYNGLDFNISYGVPIMPDRPISSKNGFWNVGFDIQFIEYYNRLTERRRNNQIQKRLVEAQ